MRGRRTFIVSLIGLFAAAAASGDEFPLQPGNSWLYRATGTVRTPELQTVDVGPAVTFDGREYYRLRFFGRQANVRKAADGTLYEFDERERRERVFLSPSLAAGQSFDTSVDPCTRRGRIESRDAAYKGPLGDFAGAVRIVYEPSCADAGVTSQTFLPYVGLIQHVFTSIAGPVQYDLIYTHIGLTEVAEREMSFRVALDSPYYTAGDRSEALVRMTLRSSHPEPIVLQFPSSQNFDIAIRNERNEIVYVWSRDKLFAQVYRTEPFGPGERNFATTIPLAGLAPGKYAAEAWLTLDSPVRKFAGTVAFEIRAR